MAKEIATLFVELRGSFAKFSADMGQIGKGFGQLGKQATKLGKTFSTVFTLPLAGMGAAAVAAANEVDDAMDSIRIGTGKTGAELDTLNDSFKTVSQTATQEIGETAKTIADLSSHLGLTGAPLDDLTAQVLSFAQVTKQDLGGVVTGTTQVMNAWKVSTEDQAGTMDFLFKVVQKTGASFSDITSTVSKFQPTLSQLGLGLKEGAALFGLLQKSGANTGAVMSGLTKAVATFSKAGIKDMGAALKTTFDAIKNSSSSTVAAANAAEIFGKKAGPQLASLIRQGKLSIDDFVSALDANGESINKAKKDTDGFGEAWAQLKNVLKIQLAEVGAPIMEKLAQVMQAMVPIIQAVGEGFKNTSATMKEWVLGIGAGLAALGPVILGVSTLFTWLSKLVPIVSSLGPVFVTLGGAIALLITPLGLVAAAVGVAIAAWYKWDVVKEIVSATWEVIKTFAAGVGESIQAMAVTVNEVVTAFGENLYNGFQFMCVRTFQAVTEFSQNIIAGFMAMKDQVLVIVGEMINGITDWFTGKFEGAKQAVASFASDVEATFDGLYDAVIGHSSVPDLVNGVGENFAMLGDKMVVPTKTATAAVAQSFEQIVEAVRSSTKKGVDESGKLGDAWKKASADLKSVISDLSSSFDPLRQEINSLLQAKDFSGLQKLAEGFKGSKDGLDQFRKSLGDAKGDFAQWQQNQAALNERLAETKDQLYELSTGKQLIDPLTKSIVELMQAGDMSGLEELGSAMQDTEEHAKDFDKALGKSMSQMQKMKDVGNELAGSLVDGLGKMLENFGVSGDLTSGLGGIFKDLLKGAGGSGGIMDSIMGLFGGGGGGGGFDIGGMIGNLFGGGGMDSAVNDLMKNTDLFGSSISQATEGLGGLVDYAKPLMASFDALSLIGKDTAGTLKGLGQIGGTALGSLFGPMGASVGGQLGEMVGSFLGGIFGGGKNPETMARKKVENWLEDQFKDKSVSFFNKEGKKQRFDNNFKTGDSTRFNKPGWGDAYQKTDSFGTFDAVGKGLTKLLGITEDVGGQIGFILSENLSGNIDNARILMQELGVTEQQMTDAFVASGEDGSMSWHAVEVALQGVSAAFGEGLVAVGDMAGGFQQVVDSGGDGMDAIMGIKNAAIEAGEAGVTSFAAWREALLAAGSDPAYVDAFFQALDQRGITSLDQIKDATNRTLGGVIADMESLSPALAEQWHLAQAEAMKYAETISKIPDNSTKNVQLNVTANISGDAKKALDMAGGANVQATPFAKGGIVKRPTLGLVGEAGPEAIMPLGRLNGMLRNSSMSGNGGGTTYNIDARNASPGVERDILRAMDMMERRATENAVLAVAEARDRGGNFSDSF